MRWRLKDSRGFSLVEMMITIAILGIVAGIAIPNLIKYKKTYEFWEDAGRMEYLIKQAKIIAMERTTNVGICVPSSGGSMTIRDLGTSRGTGICGGTVLQTLTPKSHVSITGSGGSIDPRGLAIWTGSVCASYDGKYVLVCISRAGIRVINPSGGCTCSTS